MIITVFKDGSYVRSEGADSVILADSEDYLVTIDTAQLTHQANGETV